MASIPQFASDIKSWSIRTEKLAQSFVRAFVDSPTWKFDFTRQLRDIIYDSKPEGGYITLKASSGGTAVYVSQQIFAGDALFKNGLTLFISYKEAQELWGDIWYTLNFFSDRQGKMSGDYKLDIDLVLNDLHLKILDMYKHFYDLFSEGPSDTYTVTFSPEKGLGLSPDNSFVDTYGKILGFKQSSLILNRKEKQDFQEKVASLVFYLVFVPNAFALIQADIGNVGPYFAYADVFGLYTHEYVISSAYKYPYTGSFLWTDTSGEYTSEKYKIWMDTFKGIFKPEDIRLFVAFSNKEGINTLDYIMKHYNSFLKKFGNTVGLDPKEFNGIYDLRK